MYPQDFCFFKHPEGYKIPKAGWAAIAGVCPTHLVCGVLLVYGATSGQGEDSKIPSLLIYSCPSCICILPAA